MKAKPPGDNPEFQAAMQRATTIDYGLAYLINDWEFDRVVAALKQLGIQAEYCRPGGAYPTAIFKFGPDELVKLPKYRPGDGSKAYLLPTEKLDKKVNGSEWDGYWAFSQDPKNRGFDVVMKEAQLEREGITLDWQPLP